jgi:hypothetical protein
MEYYYYKFHPKYRKECREKSSILQRLGPRKDLEKKQNQLLLSTRRKKKLPSIITGINPHSYQVLTAVDIQGMPHYKISVDVSIAQRAKDKE